MLQIISLGLMNIHDANIIHKDYHSGNIFVESYYSIKTGKITVATTGDLGLSKSATESLDDENEIYGSINVSIKRI